MSRRPGIRKTDIKAALAVLRDSGCEPVAFDLLPDGTCRWHLAPLQSISEMIERDLDEELADFERKNAGRD